MKVYLSAGHNVVKGKGNGAHSIYGDEGVLAAELRDMISARMKEVCNDADTMPLGGVVRDVNKRIGRAGLAVELHFNSSANAEAHGAEAVVANNASSLSKKYAGELAALVADVLEITNRKVKTEGQSQHSRLAFVHDTHCPAVILEICFLSNAKDMERYMFCKEKLAERLAEYFNKL